MKKNLTISIAILSLNSSPVFANSVDVGVMDIAGVKLGMSMKEAVQAVIGHYEIEKDKVKERIKALWDFPWSAQHVVSLSTN